MARDCSLKWKILNFIYKDDKTLQVSTFLAEVFAVVWTVACECFSGKMFIFLVCGIELILPLYLDSPVEIFVDGLFDRSGLGNVLDSIL